MKHDFDLMTDAQKFTYLWGLGQRQFPMRGGGVSPVLVMHFGGLIVEPIFKAADFECRYFWDMKGKANSQYNFDNLFDLLPIPLPDYQAKYEAAQSRIAEQDKRIAGLEVQSAAKSGMILYLTDIVERLAPKQYEFTINKYRTIAKGENNETE